jgi:hypothetical protein
MMFIGMIPAEIGKRKKKSVITVLIGQNLPNITAMQMVM